MRRSAPDSNRWVAKQCLLCRMRHSLGVEVDLGGFDGLMAEPKGDYGPIYASLEEFHGGGVPKHVG